MAELCPLSNLRAGLRWLESERSLTATKVGLINAKSHLLIDFDSSCDRVRFCMSCSNAWVLT